MNFVGLWVRIISLILIMLLAVVLILILVKNKGFLRWIISIATILAFLFPVFSVLSAIVNPSIQIFVGKYIGFEKPATGISFFSLEYCFEVDNQKKYVSSDAFSANILNLHDLEIGCTYEVLYESNESIILEAHRTQESE